MQYIRVIPELKDNLRSNQQVFNAVSCDCGNCLFQAIDSLLLIIDK